MSYWQCPKCGQIETVAPCTNIRYCLDAKIVVAEEKRRSAIALIAELNASNGNDSDLRKRAYDVMYAFGYTYRTLSSEEEIVRDQLYEAVKRWMLRYTEVTERSALERATRIRLAWRRITIGTADITEHVAAMFDAIIGSTDWGSGCLSSEDIESILIVGMLAGFDVDTAAMDADSAPVEVQDQFGERPTWARAAEHPDEYNKRRRDIVEAWKRQIAAKAKALAGDNEP